MALPPDNWLRDQQALEQQGRDILHKVFLRNQQPRAGLQASRLDNQIAVLVTSFDKKLIQLQTQLDGSGESGVITSQEQRRRQRLLDALATTKLEIESSLRNPSSSTRSQLLGHQASGSVTNEVLDVGDPESMQQMTRRLQQEQDKGLDMLDEIITRQKGLVRGIGNQIDVQNEIIEDIGDNIDSTQVRLVRNTRNVERISNKSNTCFYWIIIVLLLVAIVVASTV